MENIKIEGTETTPSVDFNFQQNSLRLGGRCYTEDISEFFAPVFKSLEDYLDGQEGSDIEFNFELTYFNSSTSRFILRILDQLDTAAGKGNTVSIFWHYEDDDEDTLELGEEYAEDLQHASFEMKPFPM